MLGLGPREFCRLTWKQYHLLVDAAVAKRDAERRFIADMTANQMNCWLDKNHRLTGAELLGEGGPRRRKQPGKSFAEMDELQRAAALEAIKKRAGGKRGKQAGATT